MLKGMQRTEELWSDLILERVDEGGRVSGEFAERSRVGRISESLRGRHGDDRMGVE